MKSQPHVRTWPSIATGPRTSPPAPATASSTAPRTVVGLRREIVVAAEPDGGRPPTSVRGGVEVDEGMDGSQFGQLVEEEQGERQLGVETMGRFGSPVRHDALVERAAQR